MKKILRDYLEFIGVAFLGFIVFSYINSPHLMGIIIIGSIIFILYKIITGNKRISGVSLKNLSKPLLITALFATLDTISTKLWVLNEGLSNEGNPLMRSLISHFGENILLLIPFFYFYSC